MNTQITVAALVAAATTGFAAAGSLELDRAYAAELKADAGARSVLNQGNMSNLEVSAGVRFGYAFNSADGRANSDNDDTMGFQFNDVEVAIEGDVTDNMHARLSFDFGPNDSGAAGGGATLEDAFVDWTVNDSMTLRVGQFVPAFSSEASTSEFHTMNSYRSVSHEWLATPSWTQGVEAHFGGDTWGFAVGFSDGPNTSNTAFNGAEADFALNARFDFYSDSDKARFADQTSWRGSASGWRAGAGVMYFTAGNTNPAAAAGADTADTIFTIDAAYEADGWALRGAFYYYDNEVTATANPTNMGFELGGSFFFTDQWEGFARWDTLMVDNDAADGQLVSATGDDVFNFVSVGANYYFVPESHAAKLTLELGVSLDATDNLAGVAGDTGVGVFGNAAGTTTGSSGFFQENAGEDGQLMLSATMQWLF